MKRILAAVCAAVLVGTGSTVFWPEKALGQVSMTDIADPDAYTCDESGYITFEDRGDQTNLSTTTIAGVQFTTTDGNPWYVGDFATGSYSGKYPSGGYTSQGTRWAWLGDNQGAGRITFANGPASTFSLLVSLNQANVVLEGYDAAGNLLETAGPAGLNFGTGRMTELKIERESNDLASVVVHDSGNFFLVDAICTDAPGVPTTSYAYVALGDSFSAGEGVNPYFDKGAVCHRSKKAYSVAVTLPGTSTTWYSVRNTPGHGFGFLACSGATTNEVVKNQIKKPRKKGNENFLALGPSTDVVTITVGGNDLKFSDVLKFCAIGRTSCHDDAFGAEPTLQKWVDKKLPKVQSYLVTTYRAIRKKAPNARIVVLGYPQLFPDSAEEQNCKYLKQRELTVRGRKISVLFSQAELTYLRSVGVALNDKIAKAAAESGVAEFVPVDQVFADHEVCGSKGEWISHPSLKLVRKRPYVAVAEKSFHPNTTGQSVYGLLVNSHLSPLVSDSDRTGAQTRNGGQLQR